MARREWRLRLPCAHEGCNESANYSYATRRDMESSFEVKNYGWTRGKWRCSRHERPNEVLSPENMEITTSYTSQEKEYGVFWGGFGFMHGPGFKAWAKDFPPGTTIIISARIQPPINTDAAIDQERGDRLGRDE